MMNEVTLTASKPCNEMSINVSGSGRQFFSWDFFSDMYSPFQCKLQ